MNVRFKRSGKYKEKLGPLNQKDRSIQKPIDNHQLFKKKKKARKIW